MKRCKGCGGFGRGVVKAHSYCLYCSRVLNKPPPGGYPVDVEVVAEAAPVVASPAVVRSAELKSPPVGRPPAGTMVRRTLLSRMQGCWEAFCGTGRGSVSAGFGCYVGLHRAKSPSFLRPKPDLLPDLRQTQLNCRPRPAAQLLPICARMRPLRRSRASAVDSLTARVAADGRWERWGERWGEGPRQKGTTLDGRRDRPHGPQLVQRRSARRLVRTTQRMSLQLPTPTPGRTRSRLHPAPLSESKLIRNLTL